MMKITYHPTGWWTNRSEDFLTIESAVTARCAVCWGFVTAKTGAGVCGACKAYIHPLCKSGPGGRWNARCPDCELTD